MVNKNFVVVRDETYGRSIYVGGREDGQCDPCSLGWCATNWDYDGSDTIFDPLVGHDWKEQALYGIKIPVDPDLDVDIDICLTVSCSNTAESGNLYVAQSICDLLNVVDTQPANLIDTLPWQLDQNINSQCFNYSVAWDRYIEKCDLIFLGVDIGSDDSDRVYFSVSVSYKKKEVIDE
jgi:hypothetical protein